MKFCMCCHFLFAVLLLVVTDLTCFCCFQIKLSIQNTCPFNSSWYWFVLSGQNCWRQIVYGLFIDVLQLVYCCFCLIGIHSIQGWRATTRNGVTRKRRRKRSKASKKSCLQASAYEKQGNSEVIDVWKVAHHPPSRKMVACDDHLF